MKKLLTYLITFMLMMSFSLAQSPPVPSPIIGKLTLNGMGLTGYIIEVTNLRTGQSVSGDTIPSLITEANGFFVDLSKLDFQAPIPNFYLGDTIRVSVRGFSDPQATVEFIPSPPYYFNIDIVNEQQVVQCWDGSSVIDINDCPAIPEPEPEPELETETKVISNENKDVANVEAYLGQPIEIILTNKKLDRLFDGEIPFDGEDYDAKEIITIKTTSETSLFDEDFGTEPHMIFEERTIEYKLIIEDNIDLDDVHIEEPLEIPFSGGILKIIEASENEIVIRTGTEVTLNEGQSKKIDGKDVKIISIAEDSVEVSVNNVQEIISKYDERKVNGIYVLIDVIHYKGYDSNTPSSVTIVAGENTDETIRDGDEYNEREDWEWVIDGQSWGYINTEAYKGISYSNIFTCNELFVFIIKSV